jgi:hypothetical protein
MPTSRAREGASPVALEQGSAIGACHGFAVRSSLGLSFLRPGPGTPLEVVAGKVAQPVEPPVLKWVPRPDNPLDASVYQIDGTFYLWVHGVGGYRIEPEAGRIVVPAEADPIRREELLWALPAALCFTARGDVSLHAAAVEIDGSGIVFTAPGQFGKTTLAAACLKAGYRVLAEDIACCRLGATPSVLPGPSILRVRRDSYEMLAPLPNTQVLRDDPGRVLLTLDDAVRGGSAPVPLAAVVMLNLAAEGRTLRRVAPARAIPDLFTVTFNLPTDADRARAFTSAAALAGSVPVWSLERALDFASLPGLIDEVASRCLS